MPSFNFLLSRTLSIFQLFLCQRRDFQRDLNSTCEDKVSHFVCCMSRCHPKLTIKQLKLSPILDSYYVQ